MLAEKTAAMVKGAFAVQLELARIASAAMTGSLKIQDITHIPVALAGAGLRIAFRTVKANSRRLCRADKPFRRRLMPHGNLRPRRGPVLCAGCRSASTLSPLRTAHAATATL